MPFWRVKPFELDDKGVEEEDAEEPAGEGVFDDVGETEGVFVFDDVGETEGVFCGLPLPAPVFEGTPGDDT